MPKFILTMSVLSLVAVAGSAHAGSSDRPCTDKPASAYLSLEALKAKAAELGYEVRGAEIDDACAEIDVVDRAGKRMELSLDPTSGAIVRQEIENDEQEDSD